MYLEDLVFSGEHKGTVEKEYLLLQELHVEFRLQNRLHKLLSFQALIVSALETIWPLLRIHVYIICTTYKLMTHGRWMWAPIRSLGCINYYTDAKLDIFWFDFLFSFPLKMRKKKPKSWFSCKISFEKGEQSEMWRGWRRGAGIPKGEVESTGVI